MARQCGIYGSVAAQKEGEGRMRMYVKQIRRAVTTGTATGREIERGRGACKPKLTKRGGVNH